MNAPAPELPGALCAEIAGDFWFPEPLEGWREAVAMCGACPARVACLAWAIEHQPLGIWGGTTPGERRRILRQRKAAA